MASEYNERFSYSDPLHRHSSSQTTRYRLRKKRQQLVNTRGPSSRRPSYSSPDTATESQDLPDVACSEDVDGGKLSDEIGNECENNDSGNEAEDMFHEDGIVDCDDNSDSETENVWQHEFDSDNDTAVDQNTTEMMTVAF